MEGMFNWVDLLLHVANVLILYVVLRLLLYKPVLKFMAAREERLKQRIRQADQQTADAEMTHRQAEDALSDAKARAGKTVALSAEQAQARAQLILEHAQAQASNIVAHAREEAQAVMDNAQEQLSGQAAELAVEMAAKLLGREVTPADQARLVDDMLERL